MKPAPGFCRSQDIRTAQLCLNLRCDTLAGFDFTGNEIPGGIFDFLTGNLPVRTSGFNRTDSFCLGFGGSAAIGIQHRQIDSSGTRFLLVTATEPG